MNTVLLPATKLMQRLRLLPKFLLVSIIFTLPLVLVTGLLFVELEKSIVFAHQEQDGLRYLAKIDDFTILLRQHRALRHMALNGNAKVQDRMVQLNSAITARLSALQSDDAWLQRLALADAFAGIKQASQALLQRAATNAKQSYADHTKLIAQVQALEMRVADRSNLRLDPEINTHYLALTVLDNIPAVNKHIFTLAGRGASYIDSGLMEPNEEVLLASTVTSGKFELTQLAEKLDALFYDTPQWKEQLGQQLSALPKASAFFDRANNEVVKSLDQTSGDQFLDAGLQAVKELQAFSSAATMLLDAQLTARIEQFNLRRNLIMTGVLAVLMVAAYLLTGFYASFKEEIGFLGGAVDASASGDLRLRGVSHGKDEISTLVGAFSNMNMSLSQLISNVRRSAKIITVASCGIADGNNELSSRTESQASSLQETASSMEELTETVKKNTANAEHANQLARSASNIAVKGGQVVGEVVQTMASIRQSSDKVIGIIGVIDGIAFQTNILALNAAVEAARAGEQGRGFAVVAAEVRVLAQRSAAAAKEIKRLIDDSVGKVQAGGQQVQTAGNTMTEIVVSIKEVVEVVDAITTASREQSTGIAGVSGALANIDAMTQKNATLVEEAASAAASLQQQAELLADAVSVFKLDQSTAEIGLHEDVSLLKTSPVAQIARLGNRAAIPAKALRPALSV